MQYYHFSGDARLSAAGRQQLAQPDYYYEDIFMTMQEASALCGVLPDPRTQERWRRMLIWCAPLDTILDEPYQYPQGQEIYQDVIGALQPQPWKPENVPQDEVCRAAYRWGHIVRSSFSEGDISDERREAVFDQARSIGHLALQKMDARSIKDYIATCRAEGVLIIDLLTGCMSDKENKKPEVKGMNQWLRGVFSTHILLDSAYDFIEDAQSGRLALLYSGEYQARLLGAAFYALAGEFVRAPRLFTKILTATAPAHKRHKLIDN